MSVNIAAVQRLYIAYFNRPADPVGLAHWVAQLSPTVPATQAQLMAIAAGFSGSAEYANLYAGQNNTQIVNSLYQNLFGRQAEPAGLTHWASRLTAGTETFASIALQLTFSAQGTDAAAIANKLAAATAFTNALDTTPEIVGYAGTAAAASARSWLATVTHDAATLTAATAATALNAAVSAATVTGTGVAGQTFTLTTGADSFTGTANNDVFNANAGVVIDPATGIALNVNTAQNVDVLNGGAGIDTLNLVTAGAAAAVPLPQITGIEVINAQSLGRLTLDTTAVAGLTNLNISRAVGPVDADAAATTDVSVAMRAANAAVAVDGGRNVSVNLTDVAGSSDVVSIGVAAADPVGTVSVSMTGKAYTADTASTTLSAVNVTGGTTITVNQTAAAGTAAAASDISAATITQGAITIVGNASTTAVTVTQSAAVGAVNAKFTTGGVTETASAKFSALAKNDTIEMGGLTLTAQADMTAAQAASAFANLVNNAAFAAPANTITAGDTQAGGAASLATYTGVFSGWTSAAAVGDTVLFTSTTANTDIAPNLTPGGTAAGTVTITTITDGRPHDAGALGGRMGVVAGAVTVDDVNATIKSITIDGYGTSSATKTAVLETLSLSNSSAAFTLADSAATLALNVQGLGTGAALTINSAPDTLNVKSIGNNSVNLTADLTTALNVTGTGVFDAGAFDLLALHTVRVSESAGLRLNAGVANTVKSVDTTATTGAVTVTIEGARASYTGGAGVDNVTLVTNTALTKAIDLGAGNDTLIFSAAVASTTKTLSGGDGTDTLGMTVAHAGTLAGVAAFYTGFERLLLTDAAGIDNTTKDTVTINLANLGFTNHVTTRGTVLDVKSPANSDILVLDNLASGGTVVTVAAAAGANTLQTVNVKDAATGTADVLNFRLESAGSLNAGTLTAAKVETINLSSIDTDASPHGNTLTLTADSATSVTVVGNAALTLAMTGSAKVTSIDASAMTGATGLTVTSVNTTSATTITGSSGRDVLTAAPGTTADVLLGGAGNDILVANEGLTTMTGGAGVDVFRIDIASLNVNSHSTITDFAAGDLLQIAGIDSFASARVVLAGTAVFQDFANAAMHDLGVNAAGWFQFGGNTYVVADRGPNSTTFVNGEDFVVMLTGLVDLTNASFNNTHDTISL